MTLSDLLDEAVRDEPLLAVDAGAAWASGRARRGRRLPQLLAAAAAVLALLALVAPVVPVAAPGFARTTVVQGYPEHVGRQSWVSDLPARPGPLAAVVHGALPSTWDRVVDATRAEPPPEGRSHAWHAVTSSGRRHALPGVQETGEYPALSPDGTLLGSLAGPYGPYVVRDLVTGEQTRFPDVGANRGDSPTRWFVPIQAPLHWSPDGRRLATGFSRAEGERSWAVVLDVDTAEVVEVRTRGSLLGWAGGDRLAWVDASAGQDAPTLVVSQIGTDRVLERVALQAAPGSAAPPANQYGLLSGDGRWVVLTSDGSFGEVAATRWFDRTTGREAGTAPVEDLAWYPVALPGSADVVRVREAPGEGLVTERVSRDGGVELLSTTGAHLGLHTVGWAGWALLGERDRAWTRVLPVPAEPLVAVLAGATALALWRRRRT